MFYHIIYTCYIFYIFNCIYIIIIIIIIIIITITIIIIIIIIIITITIIIIIIIIISYLSIILTLGPHLVVKTKYIDTLIKLLLYFTYLLTFVLITLVKKL